MYSISITLLISVGILACGLADDGSESNSNDLSIGRRIKNGIKDTYNEFDYVVSLRSFYSTGYHKRCSGTLLSSRAVITSKSCVNKSNGLLHVEVTLKSSKLTFQLDETFDVCWNKTEVYNKTFSFDGSTMPLIPTPASAGCYDSGLVVLRLSKKRRDMIGLSSTEFPTLTSEDFNFNEMEGIIAGWGNAKGDSSRASAYGLNYYPGVPFIDFATCSKFLPKILKNQVFNETTLCSNSYGVTGLCNGDDGGALLLKSEGDMHLVGVHRSYFTSCSDINILENEVMLHYKLAPFADNIQKFINYLSESI